MDKGSKGTTGPSIPSTPAITTMGLEANNGLKPENKCETEKTSGHNTAEGSNRASASAGLHRAIYKFARQHRIS